jgi:hypothetical protein
MKIGGGKHGIQHKLQDQKRADRFLEKNRPGRPPAGREVVFACPDRYGALLDMIETYRQGLEGVMRKEYHFFKRLAGKEILSWPSESGTAISK